MVGNSQINNPWVLSIFGEVHIFSGEKKSKFSFQFLKIKNKFIKLLYEIRKLFFTKLIKKIDKSIKNYH